MNKMADALAARAAADLRTTTPEDKALYTPDILEMLENAAKKLDASQASWHSYRDQYCEAVGLSYTSGSSGDTAMEECLYETAAARVRQLRLDFPDSTAEKKPRH